MRFDVATEDVWADLRATRSNPPAPAVGSADRRETYTFALEQAEQMFRAAATVGPATRPLLLFYGLSQAGRAIAAAAAKLDRPDEWRLVGHGISQTDLRRPLPDIEVYAGSKGSFVRLSEVLDSPVWAKAAAISLGPIWDTIPENRLRPIGGEDRTRRTPLLVDGGSYGGPHSLESASVAYFPPWLLESSHPREDLAEYMESYPEADFHSFVRKGYGPAGIPDFTAHRDGWGELVMNFEIPGGKMAEPAARRAHLLTMARRCGRSLWFFPSLRPFGRSLHPLMSWWAVLHTLSVLARYQPAEWAKEIAVDSSGHAVPIERLLTAAIDVLPVLIVQAMDEVS